MIQYAFKKKCSERITYSEPILGKGSMGQKPRFWQRKNPENQWFSGFFGGDKRDRTADLLNAIQALSQLSYTPVCLKVVAPQQLFGFLGCLTCISYAGRFTGDLLSQLSYTPIFGSLSDSFCIIAGRRFFVKRFLSKYEKYYSCIIPTEKPCEKRRKRSAQRSAALCA